MAFLALDLSKRSTGFALWEEGMARPACGTWELGSKLTGSGLTFLRLHQRINDIHIVSPIDCLAYEKPLDPGTLGRTSNFDIAFVLIGLAAHVESYAEAKGIRQVSAVHQATWRRHFVGSMKRGTRKMTLKDFAVERCRQLGIETRKDDEADAVGILDYTLSIAGITPPWRMENALVAELVGGAR